MDLTPSGVVALARSPEGKKLIRYSMVSVISVIVSQVVYITIYGGKLVHSAVWANVIAVAVGTFPSYELNRKWAWGKTGKGHMWKEVVPFWTLSFIGLAFSTLAVSIAQDVAVDYSHTMKLIVTDSASLAAWGVLWIGKFIFFNKVLFRTHPDDLEPALDGRTGLPT